MKRIYRVMINVFAAVMLFCMSLGLTACEDIKTLEVKISADGAEYTLTVDLYRHLAPKTVDKIMGYVNDGYYNETVFYKMDGYDSQLMIGDLKVENGEIAQNALLDEIYGEFESNGTKGSNLTSSSGSIGLWRSWYAHDDSYTTSSAARDSGRATWFIPTADISGYKGYFCIFAQYDTADTDNSDAITAITDIFADEDKYSEYYIYYTGEYNAEDAKNNYGLTFHCVPADEYDADAIDNLFVADDKENQLVQYNAVKVDIPVGFSAKILSITVK